MTLDQVSPDWTLLQVTQTILTFLFGVLPATFMVFWALLGALVGLFYLPILITSVGGILGYIGLIMALRRTLTQKAATYLSCGLLSIFSIGAMSGFKHDYALTPVSIGPVIVGLYHITRYFVLLRLQPRTTSNKHR